MHTITIIQVPNTDFPFITDTYTPFHLHSELAYQIKLSLRPSTRADPDVRIEIPFDRFLFIGGLQQVGKFVKSSRKEVLRVGASLRPAVASQGAE